MAEDHLQVQTASLDTVQGDLEAAASRLLSAKETMDSAVATNTTMWTTSGSSAAQRWQRQGRPEPAPHQPPQRGDGRHQLLAQYGRFEAGHRSTIALNKR